MAKSIIHRVNRNLARRLREARREVGLPTRAVAAKLPRRLTVSHSTIASYESGVTVPALDVLAALAELYQRPLNWFLENRESLSGFRYRNMKARVPLAEQRQFEAITGKWADAYINLEKHLNSHERRSHVFPVDGDPAPQLLAAMVRKNALGLDDDEPIQNMIRVLESFSARALEIKPSFKMDGATARYGDERVVVVNPVIANDRVRMNAAHELAHILYERTGANLGLREKEIEKKAYVFASALLLPGTQLAEAFEGKSFLKLIQYREKFGVSLVAMIYMAETAGVINSSVARALWSEISRRNWREIGPGYVWRDRAITFETMLECAIQTKRMTWHDAERITGIREDELRHRIASVMETETIIDAGAKETLKFAPKINTARSGG
jgi:Zn-dependent peptidase ImmA (M78 family)/transcriptional regulator with XRE-family HTH domain